MTSLPKEPSPDVVEEQKSFRQLILDFSGYTTAHGLARLGEATTVLSRIFWTIVVCGAFTMFTYQVYGLFQLYLSKPVSTSVIVTFKKSIPFPAVTICNLNMIRYSKMPSSIRDEAKDYCKDCWWPETKDESATMHTGSDGKLSTDKTDAVGTSSRDVGNDTVSRNQTDSVGTFPGVAGNDSGNSNHTDPVGTSSSYVGNDTISKNQTGSVETPSTDTSGSTSGRSESQPPSLPPPSEYSDPSDSGKPGDYFGASDTGYSDGSDYGHDTGSDYGYGDYDYGSDFDFDDFPDADSVDEETKLRQKVSDLLAQYDPFQLYNLGHSFEKLISKCKWKGLDCKSGNKTNLWTRSWNFRYGNCFTFNGGVDDNNKKTRILKASKPGPSQGLSLELNIEEEEYISALTREAGVRVVLHGQGEMIFPFEEGFSVAPDTATSVAIKKKQMTRVDRFQNNSCLDANELPETNIFRKFKNITRYSLRACMDSCYGRSQMLACNCTEYGYPSDKKACDIYSSTRTRKCLQRVRVKFNNDELECLSECQQACKEEMIIKTISTSQWPSDAYKNYMGTLENADFNASDTVLALNIFFNEMNYEMIEESIQYGEVNLLADIGGQLGLWIGMTAITCFEILELIVKIFSLAIEKCRKRHNQTKVTMVVPLY